MRYLRSSLKGFTLVLFLFIVQHEATGQTAKKMLDHDVYEIWNRINEQAISGDGNWVLYSISPENGDAELHIDALASNTAYQISRGASAAFTEDGRHVVFMIAPPKDSVRQAKLDEKKPDEMPEDSLGILDLDTGSIVRVARVKSFKLPEESGGWLAYHLKEEKEDEEPPKEAEEQVQVSEETGDEEAEKKQKEAGTTLVLRKLDSGEEQRFEAVTSYTFTEDGNRLAYTASSKDGSEDGIFVVQTNNGVVTTLLTGEGHYLKPVFDKRGVQLAFLSDRDDYTADQPAFSLYHWTPEAEAPRVLAQTTSEGLPNGWWVSEHGDIEFSEEGRRLFFGSAPRPAPESDEKTLEDEEVRLDVWHWKDPLLQPMQLIQLEDEKKRTYQAVVHLDDQRIVQLADEAIPEIEVGTKGDARFAIGNSNVPYRAMMSWEIPGFYDVYVIDVETGDRRLLQKKVQSNAELSPAGGYVAWWDRNDRAWFAQSVNGDDPVNLTLSIPHPVYNEIHDWPYEPNPYGDAGWTENDEAFLIYDKHDIWMLDPTGRDQPINITEGKGRAENLRFRYARVDPEETAIDPDHPMLLSAMNLDTKAAGFYQDRVRPSMEAEKLLLTAHLYSTLGKAKNADVFMLARQSFQEFPDIWVSDTELGDLAKVSDVNPQQADYLWGTAELTEWNSLDGIPLQGILYKPEGFDPSRKYPMMVYFYEKMSDDLHRHTPPSTARSSISFSFYTSRGYLVFVPDIPYRVGYPGESALHAVVPGVTSLIDQGFVDPDNIGVQGHSWGGYQIAYMITETNLFKAAEAGAPVVNMPSAYGGIRWGTGMSRMFQYERTQSRIGGSLWEYPMRYIDNSPLFQADKVETPLLMMHNDEDGAVPWYQGIEFFVALRRLDKPVWMLNYNGEPHGLTKYQNKRDWAIRMQQFFDHYLKGAPAPVWMDEGIPAVLKGETLGLDLVEPALTRKDD